MNATPHFPLESPIEVPAWVQLFPEPAEVWGGPPDAQAEAVRVLRPLLGLDLAAFDANWSGRLCVVGAVEPDDGTLGWGGEAHFNDWVSENWLAFRLDEANRMHFLADWRFFATNRPQPDVGEPRYKLGDLRNALGKDWRNLVPPDWLERHRFSESKMDFVRWQAQQRAWQAAAQQAHAKGGLYRPESWLEEADTAEDPEYFRAMVKTQKSWAWYVGGPCGRDLTQFHAKSRSRVDCSDRDNQFPVSPSGHPAHCIGAFSTGDFGTANDAEVAVFFEPESRVVWQCHSWT